MQGKFLDQQHRPMACVRTTWGSGRTFGTTTTKSVLWIPRSLMICEQNAAIPAAQNVKNWESPSHSHWATAPLGHCAAGPPHASGLCPCAPGAATPRLPTERVEQRRNFCIWFSPLEKGIQIVSKYLQNYISNLTEPLNCSLPFQPFDPGENPLHLQYILLIQLFRHHGDHHDCLDVEQRWLLQG